MSFYNNQGGYRPPQSQGSQYGAPPPGYGQAPPPNAYGQGGQGGYQHPPPQTSIYCLLNTQML